MNKIASDKEVIQPFYMSFFTTPLGLATRRHVAFPSKFILIFFIHYWPVR
jgi:hypothetical protein